MDSCKWQLQHAAAKPWTVLNVLFRGHIMRSDGTYNKLNPLSFNCYCAASFVNSCYILPPSYCPIHWTVSDRLHCNIKHYLLTEDLRKLQNEELHNLYSSPNIIRMIKWRRIRWARHVARKGEPRNACKILVGKPEAKRPPGGPRLRWVDSIKMELREIGWDGMDSIELPQDRDQRRALVNTMTNLRVP
jgi:hypothetical protein